MKPEDSHAHCKFTKQSQSHVVELLNTLYPQKSKYSQFRRRFRALTLISEDIGRRSFLRMGSAGYNFEKEQQLTQHIYMIHPYSKFHHYWKIIAIYEFTFCFLVRLACIAHWNAVFYRIEYQLPALLADVFETSDVLLKLLVGYVDEDTQSFVMEFRKVITKNFLYFPFYIYLIVSLPIDFFVYIFSILLGHSHSILAFGSFFKIFKIFPLSQYIIDTSKNCNWSELRMYLSLFVFITFHLSHWLSGLLFAGEHYTKFSTFSPDFPDHKSQEHLLYSYFECFYTVCTIFFGQTSFSTQRLFDTTIKANIVWFFLINLICFVQIFFLSVFIQLIGLMKTSKIDYTELKQEVQKFLAQENLPRHIHGKVLEFLRFRYNGMYFDENAILETLSPPLRREVKTFLCHNLIKNPESIFNELTEDLVTELSLLMKLKVYIAGDIIFRAGQKSSSIFFLYSGTVVIYSSKGRELKHWYCGQQFGVAAFTESHLYLFTAVALETSEIYVLRYNQFLEVMTNDPELLEKVVAAASAKIERILKDNSLDTPA